MAQMPAAKSAKETIYCVDGTPFISREEFDKSLSHPDAPKDYSYDDYVADSQPTVESIGVELEQAEAENAQLEHRNELLFGALAMIDIGMHALLAENEHLKIENIELREMLAINMSEAH